MERLTLEEMNEVIKNMVEKTADRGHVIGETFKSIFKRVERISKTNPDDNPDEK